MKQIKSNETKIAVDLDGVLCYESKPYKNCQPIKENITMVNLLYKQNNRIVIYTSRRKIDRKITLKWLKKFNIHYHLLIMGKLKADIYIDDRSLTLEEVMKDERCIII